MRWILSRESGEILQRFLASDVLLGFDFDGTLAPIVEDPDRAGMRSETRRLLRRVAAARPCVVISGRSRADVYERLAGTGVRRIIGNHGGEPARRGSEIRRRVTSWRDSLRRRLSLVPGLRVEDKGLSLTVHYRGFRPRARARLAIREAAERLPGVRLISGLEAISLVPRDAPDKGTALVAEMRRLSCSRALYVGDEGTDEDVFALHDDSRLLTVRVGRRLYSQAQYFLRNQREIDGLLRQLL
ncbi:MAG TPA: trehalose-phosphatase [Verrucomicrobiae bacterium]|nr:trehalose-phosphatase [Verrucomicrobiae bacterium]